MKAITSMKRGLARIRRDWLAGRYDQALAATDHLLGEWPDNPRLLVMRADLIQLQKRVGGPELADAKAAYQRAAALDEESPAALIELGHFLLAIEDDAKSAATCFDKAAALSKGLLKKALVGQAEALAELERQPDALACLAEAYWLESHNGKSATAPRGEEILDRLEALGRPK